MSDTFSEDEFQDVLGEVLQIISKSMDDKNRQVLESLPADDPLRLQVNRAMAAIQEKNLDCFYFVWTYPHSKMTHAILQKMLPENDPAHFLLSQYQYVNANFKSMINHHEGMSCCADKSRTILSRLLRYFISGEEIVFNMDDPYNFAYPEKVFTTHESIVDFFEKLRFIYHGGLVDVL